MHLSVDLAEIVDIAMGLALMFTGGQFVINDCFDRRVHIVNYVLYHTEVPAPGLGSSTVLVLGTCT